MDWVFDADHFRRVILDGICSAKVSVDIMTADFKAVLVPTGTGRADSIVRHLRRLADRGVEIRLLHSGVPSSAALQELRRELPDRLTIRRCPRLHSKIVVTDARRAYVGSANLTGAGLGAKGDTRRNFETGLIVEAPDAVDRLMAYFNELWEGHHCPGCGRRDVCPVPLEEPAPTAMTPVRQAPRLHVAKVVRRRRS